MTERARGTLLGLAGLVLVAGVILGRFPLRGEAYLGGNILALESPWATGELPAPDLKLNLLDSDPVLCTFPREASMGASLRKGGGAPRWEPGLGAGEPVSLVNATAPDYPPWRLAYTWLPAWAAHATMLLTHLALALAGTFLLARARGAGVEASLAAALIYGLSGELTGWLELDLWTIAASWLPWALLGVELGLARSRRYLALAGVAIGASILGGHLQVAALGVAFTALYALVLGRGSLAPRALAATVALALGLGIGAPRLVPALFELEASARERIPFDRYFAETASLKGGRLLLAVAPELLGDPVSGIVMPRVKDGEYQANPQELRFSPGVVGLALALAAASRRKNRRLALLAIGIVVLAMPTPLVWPLWRFGPGFGSTAPTRVLAVLPLVLALLAAEGWQLLRERRNLVGLALAAIVGLLLVEAVTGFVPRPRSVQGFGDRELAKPLGLAFSGLVATFLLGEKDRRWRRVARALLLGLLVFDLAESTVRWNATARPERLYADTPLLARARELAGSGRPGAGRIIADHAIPPDRGIQPCVLLPLGLANLGTYGSAHPGRFAHLIDALAPPLEGGTSRQWLFARRIPPSWRDALSVRCVLAGARAAPSLPRGLTRVASGEVVLLANDTALPRARFFPGSVVTVRPDEASALEVATGHAFDPRVSLVVEVPGESRDGGTGAVTSATIEVDEPERVAIRVDAESAGYLALADTGAPGWRATLDGKDAPILPANVAFRAVAVPAGEHVVLFSFAPPGWPWVVALSLASGAMALMMSLLKRPDPHPTPPPQAGEGVRAQAEIRRSGASNPSIG